MLYILITNDQSPFLFKKRAVQFLEELNKYADTIKQIKQVTMKINYIYIYLIGQKSRKSTTEIGINEESTFDKNIYFNSNI